MLSIGNAVQFNQGIDRWLDAVEDLAEGAIRGLAIEAFHTIVKGSAQWSGNLAASWSLSVAAPNAVTETPFKDIEPPKESGPPFESKLHKGSPAAVSSALARARADGAMALVRLGVPVFISTGVPYAEAVETDTHPTARKAFLRGVNTPSEMVRSAAARIRRYGELSTIVARSLAARAV